jgi:hypothetical protein
LLTQDRQGHWTVNKDIKVRESKRQRGLVSFELQEPVRRLLLVRTDGKLSDDMIVNLTKEIFIFQTKHYVHINVTHMVSDPKANLISVFNESDLEVYQKDYLKGDDSTRYVD